MTGLAVLGAQYGLSPHERDLLRRVYMPWAYRAGCRSKDLISVYYEEHLQVLLI
jgi:ubiquinone biosynthesis protein Coq4